MAKKIDGVIEAVRYKNGRITLVRAFQRRGATYSDCVLIDRKTLLELVQKGEQYVTGSRKDHLASTFTVGKRILVVKDNDHDLLATRNNGATDELEDMPVF